MIENFTQPSQYSMARLTRQKEPYHYQRDRQRLNKAPRPAQPNTNQPNQVYSKPAWGISSMDYWNNVFQDYIKKNRY